VRNQTHSSQPLHKYGIGGAMVLEVVSRIHSHGAVETAVL
jgi:hypothetical protein